MTGAAADKAAKHLFAFSILYLFLLFAVLLAEHGLALAAHFGMVTEDQTVIVGHEAARASS